MKLRSFRTRLALLSVALTGSALLGFSMVSGLLIYQAKVGRLDAELQSQLLQAARPQPRDRWPDYETNLATAFGVKSPQQVVLYIRSLQANGNPYQYQSPYLPAELNLGSLLPAHPPNAFPLRPQSLGTTQLDQERPWPRPRLDSERLPAIPSAPLSPANVRPPPIQLLTLTSKTGAWRVGVIVVPHAQVAIGVSLRVIDQEMAATHNAFLITIPIVLLVIAGSAWWLAGSALQPIRQLTRQIRQVTAQGLDQRVPTGSAAIEFAELLQVFNQMLERLDRSFQQASRFSADAAHELKTPLAILQGNLERMLNQAEPESPLQQALSSQLDEVRRLGTIVRKLLLLSLADTGQMSIHQVTVDLSTLLAELAEDIELLAPHLTVQIEIAPSLVVQGDRDLLVQILQNLISNAVKYNLPQGWIKLRANHQGNLINVTISNASKDIPAKERVRIFDRFHRGNRSQIHQIDGSGLGLSLAREIARAHGGDLTLDQTPSGQTAFTLTLRR